MKRDVKAQKQAATGPPREKEVKRVSITIAYDYEHPDEGGAYTDEEVLDMFVEDCLTHTDETYVRAFAEVTVQEEGEHGTQ